MTTRLLEKAIERKLVARMKGVGGLCIKLAGTGVNGMPDRLCLFPGGLAVFVEVKRPFESPRPNQQRRLDELIALGYSAVVVDTLSDVDELLGCHGYSSDI